MVVKRKQSIAEEIDTPEIKKSRVVEPVKVKTETIILDDDDGNVLDTVLAALQNGFVFWILFSEKIMKLSW